MVLAFSCAHASIAGTRSLSVKRMKTVEAASKYMRNAIASKNRSAARCLVVPNALQELNANNNKMKSFCGLPPKYDMNDIHMCESCVDFDDPNIHDDTELSAALKVLGDAHRAATGDSRTRGRVSRVSGTPCPKAHVDRLRLRIMATLRGPGVVLHPDDGPHSTGEMREIQTNTGDVVFMRGVSNEDYANNNGSLEGGILHKSPPRKWWMTDRVIVQVDDW